MNEAAIHAIAKHRAADLARIFPDAVPTSSIAKAREALEKIARATEPPARYFNDANCLHDNKVTERGEAMWLADCRDGATAKRLARLLNEAPE